MEQEGVPASQQDVVSAKAGNLKPEMPSSNGTAAVADQRHEDAAAASVQHTQALAKPTQQPTAEPAAGPAAEPAAAARGKGAPLAPQTAPLRQSSRKRAALPAMPIQLAASSEAAAAGRFGWQAPEAGAKSGGQSPAAELHKRQRPSKGPEGPGSAERTNSTQGPSNRKRKAEEGRLHASPGDSDAQPRSPPAPGHKKAKGRGASDKQEAPWHASSRRGSRQAMMRAAVSTASSSDSEQPASDGKGNREGSRRPPSSSAVRPAVGREPAPAAAKQPGGKLGKSRPSTAECRAALERGPASAAPPAGAPAAAAEKDGSKQSKAPHSGARRPALKHEPAAPAAAMVQEEVIDVTMSDDEDQDSVQQGSEEDSGSAGGQQALLGAGSSIQF